MFYCRYSFTLTTQYSGADDDGPQLTGYAVVTLLVNKAPSSGLLSLTPSVGTVLATKFAFACTGWVDDAEDLPLLYSFYYAIYGDLDTEFQLFSGTPATKYAGALLPQGGGNASLVDGIAYVADQLAAAARASALVRVLKWGEEILEEDGDGDDGGDAGGRRRRRRRLSAGGAPELSAADVANMSAALMAAALEAGKLEDVFSAVVASASVLNAPNCSVEPACEELQRESCAADFVCGDCAEVRLRRCEVHP